MKKINFHFLVFFVVLLSVAFSDIIIYLFSTNYLITEMLSALIVTGFIILAKNKKKIEIKFDFSKFDLIFIIGLLLYMIFSIVFPDLSWDTRSYHIYLQENVFIDKINFDFFAGRNLNSFLFALGDRVHYLFRYLLGYRLGTIFSYYTILVLFYQVKNIISELTKSKNNLFISFFSIFPCVMSIIFSYIGTYYIDNFGVILLMEIFSFLLFDNELLKNRIKLYLLAMLIGLSISIKITNIIFVIPIGLYYILKNYKQLEYLKFYDYLIIICFAILPWFIYGLDAYIQTGNPVFPYYNNVFKSEFFMVSEWKDSNFGPVNIIQFILWPLYIVFNPSRAFDTKFVDMMWGIGFAFIVYYILFSLIKKRYKNNKVFVLSVCVFITYYLWEKLLIGYVRYASILLVLSFIVSVYVIYSQYNNKKWISIALFGLIILASIPSLGYDLLVKVKDYSSISEFMQEYKSNFSMILKDRKSEISNSNEYILAAIGDDSLIPSLLRQNDKIYNLEEWVTITNEKTREMYTEKINNQKFCLYVDKNTLERKKDYLSRNKFIVIEESEVKEQVRFLSSTDSLYKLIVMKNIEEK